ncbi:hypothetical protein ACFXJ8_32545 [Nonomuraea sp. NPDC059194]|uniref:hypothetical protein n=1 Tax=Nonomuraea sp. NPDC059194 TaxID=3346764 RepID=UPI003676D0D3
MTALEILTAWRERRLDPSIRIVSAIGDLDNPRAITYAWHTTPDHQELRLRTW